MLDRKIASYLSIGRKAGRVSGGEFAAEQSIKTGKASLVILSEEASEGTKKKFRNMCTFYKVPYGIHGGKDELGRCIGTMSRAVLTVNDEGLADVIGKLLHVEKQ